MRNLKTITLFLMLIFIHGCGGGGGGSSVTNSPTKAVLKVSSSGTPLVGALIAGFGVTVQLPSGVTVNTTNGQVDDSVITASGLMANNATIGPIIYTPATATAKAKLDFTIASTDPNGVGVGEFATITCAINSGSPVASDFTITNLQPVDLSFRIINGLTGALSVTTF